MRAIRRILIAIKDCEADSTPALVKGGQLARALGAGVELFHAISTPLYVDGYTVTGVELPRIEHDVRARVLTRLDGMAAKLRQAHIKVTVTAEWDYPAYEAIVRRCQQTPTDLVVADQHAGRHLAAGLLHLTDWELLRLSPVPVLLVKSSGAYRHPVILAALDPEHAYSKPAKLDQRIVAASSTLARALRGTQHALHAYAPFPYMADPHTMISRETVIRLQEAATAAARKLLDRELRAKRIPRARRHVVGREPDVAIPETAKKTHAAIVVMGAVSRSGLKRLFIGNTAERVLDLLTCDILIVKPAHFSNQVARVRRGARVVATAPVPTPL